MHMVSSALPQHGGTHLDHFYQRQGPGFNARLMKVMVDADMDARNDALLPCRALNHRSVRAVQQANSLFHQDSWTYWREEHDRGQVRHLAADGSYRLVFARGRQSSQITFRVCEKQQVTRDLIESNREMMGYPGSLPRLLDLVAVVEAPLNLFVLTRCDEGSEEILTVHLIIPVELSTDGRIITACEAHLVGSEVLPPLALPDDAYSADETSRQDDHDFDVEFR